MTKQAYTPDIQRVSACVEPGPVYRANQMTTLGSNVILLYFDYINPLLPSLVVLENYTETLSKYYHLFTPLHNIANCTTY